VVHAVNPAVLGLGAIWCARSLGIPLVASFHTYLPRYLASYGLGAFESLAWDLLRSIHNQAALNLCVSEPAAADLRRRGFERVVAGWRGGVDSELFNPRRASRRMRERLSGGAPEAPLLLYVGRLAAEKGIELLLPVLEALPGARLAIVGERGIVSASRREALPQPPAGAGKPRRPSSARTTWRPPPSAPAAAPQPPDPLCRGDEPQAHI
jgi:glycosyltransferase involved in cell wall biosynthesis